MGERKRDAGLFDLENIAPSSKKQKVNVISSTTKTPSTRTSAPRKPPQKKITKPKGKPKENNIVVGVDLGTTHSGASYARTANPDPKSVHVIKQWRGAVGEFEKMPTSIALASENNFSENALHNRTGYEVQPEDVFYTWFKLLLDPNTADTPFDSAALSQQLRKGLLRLPLGMSAKKLVQCYLEQLYEQIMLSLRTTYSQAVVKVNKIEFFLTVPAKWSVTAIRATEQAAHLAGFGQRGTDTLTILREPEAAAISSLTLAIEENAELYKKGMHVLVADLGGGTVDFQCSKIETLRPLRMSDAVMGRSGRCGSTSIDSEFCIWMEKVFGDDYTNLDPINTGIGSDFMNLFEARKKVFNGKNLNKTISINMPSLGHALIRSGRRPDEYDFDIFAVKFSGQDLKDMFDPTVEKTLALVEEQRIALERDHRKQFRVICLCGGLGNSKYVSERFQEYVDENLKDTCALITDARAWSSVVRGATIRGLEGAVVTSRVANHHIGVGVHQKFQPGVDTEQNAIIDDLGNKRAGGYVDWVLPKHCRFTDNKEFDTKLWEAIDPNWEDSKKKFTWTMYYCAEDVAPHRSDAPGVIELAEIDLDLSSVYPKPKTKVKGKSKGGAEIAEFRVVIKMSDEIGKLAVLARHKRKVIATAEIDYMEIGEQRNESEDDTQIEMQAEAQEDGMFLAEEVDEILEEIVEDDEET